jgi:hypothetical protein
MAPYALPVAVAAIAACTILLGLAVLQARLAAGAPLGRFAWGGAHEVLPLRLRVGSSVSIALYAVFAALRSTAAKLTSVVGEGWAATGIWILVGYFALGIPVNAASRSRDERRVMTPTVLALCLLSLVVALGV